MAAPLSLIVSAFAPVRDIRRTLTPQLRLDQGDTDLILIDLGKGRNRLGGSALAQVYNQVGHHGADLDDPEALKRFFAAIQDLKQEDLLFAYHDRSDGGLFVTLCEMAFAAHCGLSVILDDLDEDPFSALFSEELGAVVQVPHTSTDEVLKFFHDAGLGHYTHVIGTVNDHDRLEFRSGHDPLFLADRVELQQTWSETTYRMQSLRDNPESAREEYVRSVLPLVQERVKTLAEIAGLAQFFFVDEVDYDTILLIGKNMNRESTTEALKIVQQRLEELKTFDAESLETLLRPLAVELELKTSQLFGVLRTAVTGRTAAPPLFQTMVVLGRERCLNRIRVALGKLGNN